MAFIKLENTNKQTVTPIPNRFIDEYMPRANPSFVGVYLLGYRLFVHGETEVTNRRLADTLGLLASDVRRAWEYWAKENLVRLHPQADGEEVDIEFLPLVPEDMPAATPRTQRAAVAKERPDYSVEELSAHADEDEEVRRLFAVAEKLYGKALHYSELNLLLGLRDWLQLPSAVIEVLLEYCLSNGHKSGRYIEKVALDWADNGINTVEAAEETIRLFAGDYREIMRAFGQSRRDPAPKEIEYMKKWRKEYNMPLELVKEACERTILQTGQAKFSYADKILTEWHGKNARTADAVTALEDAFRKEKADAAEAKAAAKADKPATGAARTTKNRFNNYTGRKWDYEMLERLERERQEKSLEESGAKE